MGIRCSCGVRTKPVAVSEVELFFYSVGDSSSGTATFTIDICADRPQFGTFILNFNDSDNRNPDTSFTFTSSDIEVVICQNDFGYCQVKVNGTGYITGEIIPRTFSASVIPQVESYNGIVENVNISEFVQTSTVDESNIPIISLGCND